VDENGIKQKIRTYTDDNGQRVKEITTIKVHAKTLKVPKRIHERALWKEQPFGEAIRESRDGEAKDEVRIDDPKTVEDEEAAADANVVRGLSNAMANLQRRRAGLLGSSSVPPPPDDDEPGIVLAYLVVMTNSSFSFPSHDCGHGRHSLSAI